MISQADISTIWHVEHYRDDCLINESLTRNYVTTEGLNKMLSTMFNRGSQILVWYIALFSDDYTADGSETYATPGCTEFTDYSELYRKIWTVATPSAGATSNTLSKATFTFSAVGTVYGGMLVGGGSDAKTKDDTAGGGVLYCLDKFSASMTGAIGDVLKVTVSLSLADA